MLLLDQGWGGFFFFFFFKEQSLWNCCRAWTGEKHLVAKRQGESRGEENRHPPNHKARLGEGRKKDPAACKIKSSLLFQINPFPSWCCKWRSGALSPLGCGRAGALTSLQG